MGCSQTPVQFQEMINSCLRHYDLLHDRTNDGQLRNLSDGTPLIKNGRHISAGGVSPYMDDLLIYSNSTSRDEHDHLVRRVLAMLAAEDLHLRFAKCHWFCRHVRFLGHVVGEGTLRPDPNKVTTITNWTDTDFTSVSDVRSFLGLANFYRSYIPDYSATAQPLFQLTKANATFKWTPACATAVATLQRRLTSAPVLRQPDFALPFTISVDACDTAMGSVLHQDFDDGVHPVEFYSSSFSDTEQRYAARDKEALALIKAVRHFRYHLWGSPFRVRLFTDHQSLQHLTTQQTLSGRLWRWYEELADLTFEIEYVKGSSNVVADALSRLPTTSDEFQATAAFSGGEYHTHLGPASDVVGLMTGTPVASEHRPRVPHMFWDQEYALYHGFATPAQPDVLAPARTRSQTAHSTLPPTAATIPRTPEPPSPPPPDEPAPDEPQRPTPQRLHLRFDGAPPPFPLTATLTDVHFPDTLAYSADPFTDALVSILTSDSDPAKAPRDTPARTTAARTYHHYAWDADAKRLYYIEATGARRLVIPDEPNLPPDTTSLRTRLLLATHVPPDRGHRGADATLLRLQRSFHWPSLGPDVRRFVAGCHCQASKSSTHAPMGQLVPLEPPLRPFSHLTMDLITDLEPHPTLSYDTVLVVVCRFSKFTWLIPCAKTLTGAGTIDLLQQRVFDTFAGYPISIVSDRDPRWTGTCFTDFCSAAGIKHSRSSAAHPQSDGLTERTNRSFEEVARSYLGYDQALLWDLLPHLEFAINDTPIPTHDNHSPFEIAIGQSPFRPLDLIAGVTTTGAGGSVAEPARARIERLRATRREARELLRLAAVNVAEQANRRRRPIPPELVPGRQVWVKASHLLTPHQRAMMSDKKARKLMPKYNGPYTVLARVGPVAFRLDLPATCKAHPVIHADALKLYKPHNIPGLGPEPVEPLVIADEDTGLDVEVHEVGAILKGRRTARQKHTQYLVKWKYYPLSEASWVKFKDLGTYWKQHIPPNILQPLPSELA
eukprot:m.431879 g.431879  ORF g.431879 m.431879 type:complete len:1002 (-) comp17364_c0_seq1:98-3103(-)